MRLTTLGAILALSAASPALGGTTFNFSADIYGSTADSGPLAAGQGTFTVLDLYLTNTSADDLRVLSLFYVNIALGDGEFVHHDASGGGQWSAAFNAFGANSKIDSFVTFGAGSGSGPFAASLDPNFIGSVAGSVSANAGWFNGDPNNGQGNVAAGDRLFIGRFVIANTLAADTTFSVSGDFSYNFQSPGVSFDSDSQVFTLPSSTPAVPGPLAVAALAGVGLVGRGRRR
jgi:hypothetical protein